MNREDIIWMMVELDDWWEHVGERQQFEMAMRNKYPSIRWVYHKAPILYYWAEMYRLKEELERITKMDKFAKECKGNSKVKIVDILDYTG